MSRAMDVLISEAQVWCGHVVCRRCGTTATIAPGTPVAEVVAATRHNCPQVGEVLAEVLASVEGTPSTVEVHGG